MKTQPENLTAQQSLDIIATIIQEAKGNAVRNGFHYLLWGWVVVVANIGMYILMKVGYEYFYAVWLITIPAWIISLYKGYRDGREKRITTHFDTITLWVWVSFGVTIFTLVLFGHKIDYQLNPVITIVCGIPTLVSGMVIRFKPLIMGGVAFWIFGIICFIVSRETQPLVSAAAILCGYLVPGHLLNRKEGNV